MRVRKRGWMLTTWLLGGCSIFGGGSGAPEPPGTPVRPGPEGSSEGPSEYEEVISDEALSDEGVLTVHRVDDGEQLFRDYPELMGFLATMLARRLWQVSTYLTDLQEQFADQSTTLGLVPEVLRELLGGSESRLEPGSEREPDSPY